MTRSLLPKLLVSFCGSVDNYRGHFGTDVARYVYRRYLPVTEDLVLKLLGVAGVTGLLSQAIRGAYRTYRTKYMRPHSIIYRRLDLPPEGEEEEHKESEPATALRS